MLILFASLLQKGMTLLGIYKCPALLLFIWQSLLKWLRNLMNGIKSSLRIIIASFIIFVSFLIKILSNI